MKSTKNSLIVLVLILITLSASGQPVKELNEYFHLVRSGSAGPVPPGIFNDGKNDVKILNGIEPYLKDTTTAVRVKALYIAKSLGRNSSEPMTRQKAVQLLCKSIEDDDYAVRSSAIDALTTFSKNDFSTQSNLAIASAIRSDRNLTSNLLKIAGYLNLNDLIPDIRKITTSPKAGTSIRFAARVALVRMNDPEATEWLLNKLSTASVTDDFVYDVVPELIYTRNPEVFRFLEGIIKRDDKQCYSSDADSDEKINCAYRILELMAPALNEFPLRVDDSGDLIVRNYADALIQSRAWFADNPHYTLSLASF